MAEEESSKLGKTSVLWGLWSFGFAVHVSGVALDSDTLDSAHIAYVPVTAISFQWGLENEIMSFKASNLNY